MYGLNPLANIALGDVSSDFPLHASPPKPLFEILKHFSTTRMNRELSYGLHQELEASSCDP
jgi:hypothetical protein